jgi:hypothetical protein
MSLFKRLSCLFISLLFFGGAVFSDASAFGFNKDKRKKAETAPGAEAGPNSKLMGQTAAQTLGFLGSPTFKRGEGGAEVWQYARGGCILNLFLFEKTPPEGIRVQYLDVYPATAKPDEPVLPLERQRCLRVFADGPAPTAAPPK